ncbi:MAG: serine hydrolase domain-containing protein [Rikenellaceae bacterium]
MTIKQRIILKGVLYILLLVIVLLSIVLFTIDRVRVVDATSEVEELLSLNFLLDNDMSELEGTKRFDKTIEAFMRRWEIKGASFALMRNDSLVYAKGYGYASVEDSVLCDVNHVMRVASISKLITAAAVMKLCEGGWLALDSQVFGEEGVLSDSIFLDLHSSKQGEITVEHLLRHTAGFSTAIGDVAFNNSGVGRTIGKQLPIGVDDMVVYAAQNRIRTQPGGSYDYSNLGYIVLGKVVEKVSGMPYETYVRDSILVPSGCYDMYIGRSFKENQPSNEVSYYETKEAEPVDAYDGSMRQVMKSRGGNNVQTLSAAGGWVTSSVELLRFVAAINKNSSKPDILSPQTIDMMLFSDEHTKPIGWSSTDKGVWKRSGSMAGTNAYIKAQADGYTWAFVANSSVWIGPKISSRTDYAISRAVAAVTQWPSRDLFAVRDSIGDRVLE